MHKLSCELALECPLSCSDIHGVHVYVVLSLIYPIDFYCVKSDAIAYTGAHFGQGTGPIWLDNLACTGAEYNLTSCSYDSDTSDCGHYEDAGVRCNTTCGYNSVVCVEIGLSLRIYFM